MLTEWEVKFEMRKKRLELMLREGIPPIILANECILVAEALWHLGHVDEVYRENLRKMLALPKRSHDGKKT